MHKFFSIRAGVVPAILLTAAACGGDDKPAAMPGTPVNGPTAVVVDTVLPAAFEASGPALPVAEATMSTKLMGAVTAVLVTEGSRVAAGAPLVRLDAADLDAKAQQAAAGVAAAEAAHREASAQAARIRSLYADSAAPKAQLDAVEAGLARATAGLQAARAGTTELNAVRAYGVLRAPFAGVVTHRFVDAGDFAAPGAPLVTVQDASRLRISAAIPAAMARRVKAGQAIAGTIEGTSVRAVVEGVVPSASTMYTVNAIVANAKGELPAGAAATLSVPAGTTERALLVPQSAVVREGDLTGVRVVRDGRAELRWVRLGDARGDRVVVRTGLQAGERVALAGGER
ncbi:MAG: efflux RND transporter periplasmic adaptor subunit [Gemmatimonadetes bacterium]|nr:efflux RND transporter periplasmic adaptor subunit [Gemmatimonadota bacterium]